MSKETITLLNKITKLIDDLEWERDRMSSSGQSTLDKYWLLVQEVERKWKNKKESLTSCALGECKVCLESGGTTTDF